MGGMGDTEDTGYVLGIMGDNEKCNGRHGRAWEVSMCSLEGTRDIKREPNITLKT